MPGKSSTLAIKGPRLGGAVRWRFLNRAIFAEMDPAQEYHKYAEGGVLENPPDVCEKSFDLGDCEVRL